MTLRALDSLTAQPSTPRLPALFIGHGSPMNALEDNRFTRHLGALGARLDGDLRPRAILVVSAHWLTRGTFVQAGARPETIHDFGGFPPALFEMRYAAPGAPELARETAALAPGAATTEDWGLDHGAWTILHHIFPQADIPVYQLSIDYGRSMQYHYELAARLVSLREKGVLIVGSGNVVHNLPESFAAMSRDDSTPASWAVEFDEWVRSALLARKDESLLRFETHPAARRAVPTPDHYIPLLYTLGVSKKDESVSFTHEEVYYGGLSMRSVAFGLPD